MPVLQQLAVSIGLGLLLGLQRERTEATIGGIRTFPLIAIFGTVCAQLSVATGPWVLVAGFASVTAIIVLANVTKLRAGDYDPGATTEIAALLMYALGAYVVLGSMVVAVVLGGIMALLLHWKQPMHRFANAIGEHDMRAIMQFVLVTLVVLPVLPNRPLGPYGVWNPFETWLIVCLIVAIGLLGYVVYKLFGARAGTVLGGIIGGLVSSTATTVSHARQTSTRPKHAEVGAFVIMVAACVSMVRVLVEIGAVAGRSFTALAPPLIALAIACIAIAAGMYFLTAAGKSEVPEPRNPAELKSAVLFGALYALVLLIVAWTRERVGPAGLYAVGVVSGLTDMDAITLSTARLVHSGQVEPATGWRTILLAAMANFVFKLGIVAVLGNRPLLVRVAMAFALALASGGLILAFWPS